MNPIIRSLAVAGAIAAAGGPGAAWAQAQSPAERDPTMRATPTEPPPGMRGTTREERGATTGSSEERRGPPLAAAPLPGANSFTEGQARGRLESAGLADVTGLQKDEHGVWRGKAMQNGSPTDVALDFRGNVVIGAGAAPGSLASTSRGEDRDRATGAGSATEPSAGGGGMTGPASGPAMNRSPDSGSGTTGTGPAGSPTR